MSSHALREIALTVLVILGTIVVGVEVLRGHVLAGYTLVLVVSGLLATTSRNAWLILVEEEDA